MCMFLTLSFAGRNAGARCALAAPAAAAAAAACPAWFFKCLAMTSIPGSAGRHTATGTALRLQQHAATLEHSK